MSNYDVRFMSNGRIVFIPEEDIEAALKSHKEIFVVCGEALVIGGNEQYDEYINSVGYSMYSFNIDNEVLTPSDISERFYKVIITEGVKVWMETGFSADHLSSYGDCKFFDWMSDSWKPNVSKEEYDKMRNTVDCERTLDFIHKHEKDGENKVKALSGYMPFYQYIKEHEEDFKFLKEN